MIKFLQTDPKWGNEKLGYSQTTISANGCFVTSLAMLSDTPPNFVNNQLKNKNGFSGASKNLVISEKAADILNLEYHGKSASKPSYDTIAEVYVPKGQHFIVVLADGTQVDPLGKGNYKIKNYRLFKRKENMSCEIELEKNRRWLKARKEQVAELEKENKKLKSDIEYWQEKYKTYFRYLANRKKQVAELEKLVKELKEKGQEIPKELQKLINEISKFKEE